MGVGWACWLRPSALILAEVAATRAFLRLFLLCAHLVLLKMDPRRCIRNGFAHGNGSHSHFYAAWSSRHEPSMIPKALKIATLQKKMAPIPPHT